MKFQLSKKNMTLNNEYICYWNAINFKIGNCARSNNGKKYTIRFEENESWCTKIEIEGVRNKIQLNVVKLGEIYDIFGSNEDEQ